ncbi:MAG: hypothetical protein JWL80_3 [Parcubacteria group bacterium]|nr:hypothetical protein [Parcubacteria group bacterium]
MGYFDKTFFKFLSVFLCLLFATFVVMYFTQAR